jgi:hypothetical protein
MKDRRPRKLKKIAKKRKVAADAFVMVKAAMAMAQGCVQIVIITSSPVPVYGLSSAAERTLRIAMATVDTTHTIHRIMSEIKPWRIYA